MFRACSTAKLFLDHMLPDTVDAGVYLDTDILLLDDITHLINHLTQFSPGQVMGLAATENIYNVVDKIPYYGPPGVGLNAGVILVNVTRMRRMSGGGFTGAVRWVTSRYRDHLYFADQDILNAIFGTSPW